MRILNAFHCSVIKLFLKRKSFMPSKINSPDFSSKADSPIITIGYFAF